MALTERQKELHRVSNARWRERHREEINAKQRVAYSKKGRRHDPQAKREYQLRFRYGITFADKIQMFDGQEGLCKLCHLPLKGLIGIDTHVDHKPGTKLVRGLVHAKCNQLIKAVENSIDLVDAAKAYIEEFEDLSERMIEVGINETS